MTDHKALTIAALLAAAGAMPAAAQLNQLFAEDWDSVTLFPSVDENVNTGDNRFDTDGDGQLDSLPVPNFFFGDAVDAVPFDGQWNFNGWIMEFNHPGLGTADWNGWSIANLQNWITAAGDQDRSLFTKGSGNVLVADPDEWDDFAFEGVDPTGDGREFESSVTSPRIPLTDVVAGTLQIRFDSTWRPEDTQFASLAVSYDDGPFTEILSFTSDGSDTIVINNGIQTIVPDGDQTDATDTVLANNPEGAGQVRFQFFLSGTNDWWWAIDNIVVLGEGGTVTAPPQAFRIESSEIAPAGTIAWQVAPNAAEYDVLVANDASFTDVIAQTTTSGTTFTPATGVLVPGSYFVRVTARNLQGSVTEEAPVAVVSGTLGDLNGDNSSDAIDNAIFLNVIQDTIDAR